MGIHGELSPYDAQDAAAFVELMRRLKERSGLTFRELEERAARGGDTLARSTLADILRRTSLPRPDVLEAFVRACGDGQRVGVWLDARERLEVRERLAARTPAAPAPEAPPPDTEAVGARSRPGLDRRRTVLVTGLAIPVLGLALWGVLSGGSDGSDGSGAPDGKAGPADGWVTIRPVQAPDLCLTDGRDPDKAYGSAIAVQLPCAQSTVPRTYLEPAGESLYRIQWHHPSEGKGCLAIRSEDPVKGTLEPMNDCTKGTLFRLAPDTTDGVKGYRLRPAHGTTCVGTGDNATDGAPAVEERCADTADQLFLIWKD
ncbi:helix-turn-helix domain-containing protein [Streptomyces sp. NPDC091292]|uniref:helix-turn-helix domain-containing protein n=1 Tax=Streptomyces sp. NPDC091292 TaxID=3365991 RepID=UPI00382BD187